MSRFSRVISAVILSLATPFALAEEPEKADHSELIDAVVTAYGGDALTGIENYRIDEQYISPASGQSWSPALVDIGRLHQTFIHELGTGNVYFENWFAGRSGLFPTLTVVKGEEAHTVNLQNGSYGDAASADPYVIAGGTMRTTDTLLALELHKARDSAEHLGEARFQNRDHQRLKIPFPSSPDLTLYIDSETHRINRMTRENPQLGLLDYVFQKHTVRNGILRATRVDFAVAGAPNLIGANREIQFNAEVPAQTFDLPPGLKQEGARLTDEEMVVNRISDNVYHIGQNGGYSVFVDTGSEIVGSGGYPGLSQRLDRFREETGSHRPLRYQVVTHHHSDHLGGIGEALDLGATLVTVTDNVEAVTDASGREPESGRFLSVNKRLTLGSGDRRVEIYDVPTIHSASNLLVYVPAVRTLFMADHFGSPYAKGVPVANGNTMSMAEALGPLKLGYSTIVTAHNARVFNARDFQASVANYSEFTCPQDRPICPR